MFLEVYIGKESVAVELAKVQEVLLICELEKIPNSPDFLRGFLLLGESSIPVLDAAGFLGMEPTEPDLYSKIVRLKSEKSDYAIIAATVDAHFGATQKQVTELGDEHAANPCIKRLLELEQRHLPILDPDRLMDESEDDILQHFQGQIEARLSKLEQLKNEQQS